MPPGNEPGAARRFGREARFRERRAGLDSERAALDQERLKLDRQRADLDRQRADLDRQRADLDVQRAQLDRERDHLQEGLADSSEERRERTEEELDRLDQQYDRLDEQGDRLDEQGDRLDEQSDLLDEEAERLDEVQDNLDEAFEDLGDAFEDLGDAFEEMASAVWSPTGSGDDPSDTAAPDDDTADDDDMADEGWKDLGSTLQKRLRRATARLGRLTLARVVDEMEAATTRDGTGAWRQAAGPEPRPAPSPSSPPSPSGAFPLLLNARLDGGSLIELRGDPQVAVVEVDEPSAFSITELGNMAQVSGYLGDAGVVRFNPQADLHLVLNCGEARITGLAGAIHATCNVGDLLLQARLDRGESELKVNAGVVRIELAGGSDVRILNRSTGVLSPSGSVHEVRRGECTVGSGHATLVVKGNLGSIEVVAE